MEATKILSHPQPIYPNPKHEATYLHLTKDEHDRLLVVLDATIDHLWETPEDERPYAFDGTLSALYRALFLAGA